jgi:hypothetical protein
MHEFLNAYAKEEYYASNSKYELLNVRMHNPTINTSILYLYPFMDRDTRFEEIFKESTKNGTKFLIVEPELINESDYMDEPNFLDIVEQDDIGSL